jgi:hypothetical protein
MSAHVSCFTGRLRGATKRHAELYIAAYSISNTDLLFHAIRRFRPPHSIGKMKRQKLLKEIKTYESTNHKNAPGMALDAVGMNARKEEA